MGGSPMAGSPAGYSPTGPECRPRICGCQSLISRTIANFVVIPSIYLNACPSSDVTVQRKVPCFPAFGLTPRYEVPSLKDENTYLDRQVTYPVLVPCCPATPQLPRYLGTCKQ